MTELQNKNTVAYGAGGGIGGGVARTFAQEGARVFLAGGGPAAHTTRSRARGAQPGRAARR